MHFPSSLPLAGILSMICLGTPLLASAQERAGKEKPGRALSPIRLSKDGKSFALSETGKAFVPFGFNYLGKFDHLAEEDWHTEKGWKNIETDFRDMRRLGANVVRWHLQLETFLPNPDRPSGEQLIRLKKLLDLARANDLYLDLTGLSCYRLKRVPAWYDKLTEFERWQTQARFWEEIAKACSGHPAVFCYDLMNEPVINEPKKEDHPWLTGELGGFHFVQRISNKPAGRDAKDIAAAWVKMQVEAIRKHDRHTLVTVGVIPWAMVWPKARPIFYSPQAARHLDFVSIHVYPEKGKVDRAFAALEVYDLGKPLVVEEFFPLSCTMAELDQYIEGAAGRVEGWIAHYFGATPAEHRAGAKPAGPLVAEFLDYWQKKGARLTSPAPPPPGTR